MAGVRKSSSWNRSGAFAGVVSAAPCHLVLETSPPDYVKKISRYLESSVIRDEVSNEIAGADSDSGDSLFLTQKQVPEAVRSGRREHRSLRSKPVSPRELEGSDAGSLSSESQEEPKTSKDERYKKQPSINSLPKFRFPFLSGRKLKGKARRTRLSSVQNKSLHNFAMGGFFKCLIEGYERGHDAQSSLPTVEAEGQYISPLSEEEEDDEDVKVVERKRFVVLSKAKTQQTWGSQLKQRTKKAEDPRQETPQGGRLKMAEVSVTRGKPLSMDTDGCQDGESTCGVLVERERNEQRMISGGNFLAPKETAKKNRHSAPGKKKVLFQQSATEEELCTDSDATVCEPPEPQGSPTQNTHMEGESAAAAEPQSVVFHTDDLSQTEDEPESQSLLCGLPDIICDTNKDRVSNEIRAKKRKKKKKDKGALGSLDEETGQSQEEPEHLHAAAQETASLSEDNRTGPPATQTSDELEFNGRNCSKNLHTQEEEGIPGSKPKKKKRKKDKSLAENVEQEVDGNLESGVRIEDSVFSANVENGVKEKKKSGEDVEQLQFSTVGEAPNVVDAAVKKKKKKRKGEALSQDGDEGIDVSLCNGAVTSEERTRTPVKKKKKTISDEAEDVDYAQQATEGLEDQNAELVTKKKKKKKKKPISDEAEDVDYAQQTTEGLEDQNTEHVTKKKKKKKISERSGWNITDDNTTQSDDSVSVQEKEKRGTPSFLVADAKENNARTHGKQNSPSRSVRAEKAVGAGDFETESPEIAGNAEESNDRVRKKKRKMAVEQGGVEKDHGQHFDEANRTREKKKKRVRNESESVNPAERFQNAADEGYPPTDEDVAVKKKKKQKKKCHITATEDAESEQSALSNKTRNGKNLLKGKTSTKTAELERHENQKKRKKERNKGKPSTKTAELEPHENQKKRKKERNKQSPDPSIIRSSPMLSETYIDRIMKNKHKKVKRRLLNLTDDFL